MNYKQVPKGVSVSESRYGGQAAELVVQIRASKNLAKTLGVSENIAEQNRPRLAEWGTGKHAQPAVWAYSGDVYNGLAIQSFSATELDELQGKLRILSGLYGSTRPFDAIEPYRLEMRTKLKGVWGKNLYEFWGDSLAAEFVNEDWVLNCASNEYSKALLPHIGNTPVVTPVFLHDDSKGLKQKALFSKYFRGVVARWAVTSKAAVPADLKKCTEEGIRYDSDQSNEHEPVFIIPRDFSLLGRFTRG